MKNKKSKWQERLHEIARKHGIFPGGKADSSSHSAQTPDVTGITEPQSHSAQPVKYFDLEWKTLKQETPRPYALIHLFIIGQTPILEHWTRVNDGENDYFVNSDSNDNRVIQENQVIMWAYAFGEPKEKYEPMTGDDINLFTTRDLKELIERFEKAHAVGPELNTFRFGTSACIYLTEQLIDSKK